MLEKNNNNIEQFETDEDQENKSKTKSIAAQNKILKICLLISVLIILFLCIKLFCMPQFSKKNEENEILILKESDISSIITMSDIISADREALSIYSDNKSNIPLRTNIDVPEFNGQCLFMNGYAAPAKALGVKIVSVYPNNINKNLISVPATMVLVNAETGFVNALIDGTYLTRLRTGAVSGFATEILARKTVKYLLCLELGDKPSHN